MLAKRCALTRRKSYPLVLRSAPLLIGSTSFCHIHFPFIVLTKGIPNLCCKSQLIARPQSAKKHKVPTIVIPSRLQHKGLSLKRRCDHQYSHSLLSLSTSFPLQSFLSTSPFSARLPIHLDNSTTRVGDSHSEISALKVHGTLIAPSPWHSGDNPPTSQPACRPSLFTFISFTNQTHRPFFRCASNPHINQTGIHALVKYLKNFHTSHNSDLHSNYAHDLNYARSRTLIHFCYKRSCEHSFKAYILKAYTLKTYTYSNPQSPKREKNGRVWR